jgi:ribonuclease Z
MKVIPLGTSSGKPTLYRNVSAVAIAREGEWLLFDCGEATQIQVMRAGLSPNRLAAIFITHLHGDHFNGLPGFLSTMGLDRRERPLTVAGPRGLRQYLDMLARLKILYLNYPLDVKEFAPSDFRNSHSKSLLVYETPAYEVVAAPLDHRIFAIGYRVEERPRPGKFDVERARQLGIPAGPLYGRLQSGHAVQLPDGRRIESREVVGPPRPGKIVAYCTDTRPCDAGVALGRNADLLIHEATYTEDLIEEAEDFGHSTAMQAARIAERASARRLLITHFSTRYPDASPLLEEARSVFADTLMARDLTEVEL